MKTEGANMTILPCPFCGGNGECTYVRFLEAALVRAIDALQYIATHGEACDTEGCAEGALEAIERLSVDAPP